MTTTSITWPEECNARAHELATWQCTDLEISAAIAIELLEGDHQSADRFVKRESKRLQRYRFLGRAKLRGKLYRLADGDPALSKAMTRSSVMALQLIGQQHLGYTGQGFDAKVRKAAEKAEIQRSGARILTGVTGGAA